MVNADGTPFKPAAIIDGHVSRMGEPFLVYISDDDTRWYVVLGAPYGTAFWQVHDDTQYTRERAVQDGACQCKIRTLPEETRVSIPIL